MKILMGENLVYEASIQVGSHHYARLFARHDDVFWLSIPWNFFLFLKYGKTGDRYLQWNHGKPCMSDDIMTWCPFTFVPYRDNILFKFKNNIKRMLRYTSPSLKKILSEYGFADCDVLWITDPRMMYLVDIVQYKKLVYRCVDDLSHFSGIPHNIVDVEKELVNKADIVFATANTLKKRLESYGKEVYSLPNGVDYDYFANYSIEGSECEVSFYENVILYVGTLGDWFDCEFIKYCAEKRPGYTFVLVGPNRTNLNIINGIDNVKYLGIKPYNQIPLYMKSSDIGIVPFKKSKLVDAVNPLKLYEYFACGLPVVATKAHELERMKSPALLYDDYDEALEYFDALLSKKLGKDQPRLLEFAADNSWSARMNYVEKLLGCGNY